MAAKAKSKTPPQTDWATDAESRLLDAALPLATQVGWGSALVARAGREIGLSLGETELLLPNGARDLAALLSRRHDAAGLKALAEVDPKALKIRERIRQGVVARREAAMADEAALRRMAGFLALPTNVPLAMRLVWESADTIWRWAGDVATDENHYSKRAILAGILIGDLAVRIHDGAEAGDAFLSARIDNVMAFEKWKAQFHPVKQATELAQALGRIRYGKG